MKKRVISFVLVLAMVFSLIGCGGKTDVTNQSATTSNNSTATSENSTKSTSEKMPEASDSASSADSSAEDEINDPEWDELESLGKIETENGLLFVTITIPADMVKENTTQESIDSEAGETYTSGKLNDDGSVTYKMTKKQHKAMLSNVTQGIEDGLNSLIEDSEHSFTKIEHNDDFTSFDVSLSTEEVGMTESFMVMVFYLYGGMYGLLSGHENENVAVNFYSSSGELINTANSSDVSTSAKAN